MRYRLPFLRPGLLMAAALLLAAPAFAQDAELEDAVNAYYAGDYDLAIEGFTAVVNHPSAGIPLKKNAYQFMGRAYLARSLHEKAREAITGLLELEPPLIELDPDVEPPPIMHMYYDVRKKMEESYNVERADPGLQTLAVIDFTNNSIDERERFDPLQRGFPSMMIHYLNGSTDMKVVERERIQWLLDELKLQKDPALIDQSSAVRAGKLLGANAVLIGAYTVHGKQMWLSSRLVKVETGEILLSEQVFGKPDKFFELIEKLSVQVAQAVNVAVEPAELGSRTETRSLDAMMSYSEGLQLMEGGDYLSARAKFQEALEFDPTYERAKLKSESLRPMIAAAQQSGGASKGGGR